MGMEMWRMRPCILNHKNKNKAELKLMDIPSEMLIEILKRVPTKSVYCIRCVNKRLLSIVDTPSFATLHTRSLIGADFPHHIQDSAPQHTLLTYISADRKTRERLMILQSLNYDQGGDVSKILQTSTPRLPYTVHFVFCNLFCMRYRCPNGLGFIINPLRGEILRLPPTDICADNVYGNMNVVVCDFTGMGFDSITNTYKILRVSVLGETLYDPLEKCHAVSQVLIFGTSEWRRIPSAPEAVKFLHCNKNVCAFGDVHWLLSGYTRQGMEGKTHILSFDFKREDFFWIPNPYILPRQTSKLHFISFRGSMALVDPTSDTSIEIWVMKDYSKKQWRHDYSINIHMLELAPRFIFFRAFCGEWEHGIVFTDEWLRTTFFLDLRPDAVTLLKHVSCPTEGWKKECRRILSPYRSLISLKSYANLDGEEEPATYQNWSEGEASGNNFFYLTR